ncbi:TPA: ribulose-phosphate 3-epimerase [Candidatus Avacholeplasma faecigallinarum]|nr:ribulose-phosphate 3-epimerase [Candidatus Avacholeplasma faecigallinarum]
MKVSLSILTIDYANVEKNLKTLLPNVDYIHMDVMDGVFVPNISFGYTFIKSLRKLTNIDFDTHLMIEYPQNYIKQFAEAGSQYITFHVEAKCDVQQTINLIHQCGCKAGIAIKPNTSVDSILSFLPEVDMVLVMSVEPGFGGQKFMPSSIEKVKRLYSLKEKNNYKYLINIDGGINDNTILNVKDYIDLAVVGSYICNAADPIANAQNIKNN